MNETMEKAKFMKKASALAKSSRQYIEGLWNIGIDVSRINASITSLFSSIFNTLVKAFVRVVSFSRGIREFTLPRFTFLPPFNLWSRRVTPPEEEYPPTEMGRANVSFLFKVTVARKIARELAERVAVTTPKPALLPIPPPRVEVEFEEEELAKEPAAELIEKPARPASYFVTDLQRRFESKLAPSVKGMTSAFQEFGRHAFLLAPLVTGAKSFLMAPTPRLWHAPSQLFIAPPEKEAAQIGSPHQLGLQHRPSAIGPREEVKVEPPLPSAKLTIRMAAPPVSMPVARLRPDAVSSLEYAARLPSTLLEQEVPILRTMPPFPRISAPKSPLPSIKPSFRYSRPTSPPMGPSQIDRLLEEIFPSLTFWIYAVSEMLRSTALGLPAVSVVASTVQRTVTQALVHPISSFEKLRTLGTQAELFSTGLMLSKPETGVERIAVEAFSLPVTVASLIAAHSQNYFPLIGEPRISETWESFEPTQAPPKETAVLGEMPRVKGPSKLEAIVGLAAVESSIAQNLHQQFTTLTREIEVFRSSYGERLGELSAFGPIGTTTLSAGAGGRLARAPTLLPTLQPHVPHVLSTPIARAPSPPKLRPISPTIQNTFNITISAEEAEEDLRDLERKVAQILSDQIRRYYGSMRL